MKINNILAVDTSTQKLSMSLYSCRKNKIYCYEESVSDHSENLIKFLNKLLIKTNVKLDDITHIGVNTGPGSFTGLRIGLSFVKTLARYLNIKVITTTSFNMILWEIINSVNIEKTLDIITLFPSVKNEFYFCKFRIESKKIIEQKSQIGYIKTDDFYKLEEFDVLAYPDFIEIDKEKLALQNSRIIKVPFSSRAIIRLFFTTQFCLYKILHYNYLFPFYLRHTYY